MYDIYIYIYIWPTVAENRPAPGPNECRATENRLKVTFAPLYINQYLVACEQAFGRGDDTVGNPYSSSKFSLVEQHQHSGCGFSLFVWFLGLLYVRMCLFVLELFIVLLLEMYCCIYIYIYIYIYTHIYTHVYIYIYIHVYRMCICFFV